MSLAIHPYISGQPFRIKYLEAIYDYVNKFEGVVHWNGEQILDWYNGQTAGSRDRRRERLRPARAAGDRRDRSAGRRAAVSFPFAGSIASAATIVDHIREMKEADERDPPFFFQKPRDAVVPDGAQVPYPPFTSDFQFEVELVIAIGRGGRDIAVADALDHIWGYAVGIDLTRRDRQRDARDLRLPWEIGKSFDASAPCGAIAPARDARHFKGGTITLSVNGTERQRGDIGQMIWSVPEIDRAIVEAGHARARRPDLYRHAGGRRSRRAGRSDCRRHRRAAVAYRHHRST